MKKNYVIPEMEMKRIKCCNILAGSDNNYLDNGENEDAGAKNAYNWDE